MGDPLVGTVETQRPTDVVGGPDHLPAAAGPTTSRTSPTRRRLRPHSFALVVLALGLLITAVLSWTSWSLYNSSENRLLELRVRDAGSLLDAVVPTIRTPLVSAVEIASGTNGNSSKFDSFITPDVIHGSPFASATLWNLNGVLPARVAVVGKPPSHLLSPASAARLFASAKPEPVLNVIGVLNGPHPHIDYFVISASGPTRFAVYAESAALPANHRLAIARNSAFSDLDYALYLGKNEQTSHLLATSLTDLPIAGRRAAITIPFGTTALDFVVTPKGPLSSAFFEELWWITLLIGIAISLSASLLTRRLLVSREGAEASRERAEELTAELDFAARENRRLYAEQRSVAETLQRALLPIDLPELAGIQCAVRYIPGVAGIEIGGDWYDVIDLDDTHLLLVVGDVSGRGLGAATVMASLRFAVRAYALEGYSPARILGMLNRIVRVGRDRLFATVLCVAIDVPGHTITLASAGHLSPVILDGPSGRVVETRHGLPIGVQTDATYDSVTVELPSGATLLAFTDGLIERRGEALDDGFSRLLECATSTERNLDRLLDDVLAELTPNGVDDDTAIVGLRWTS